MHRVFLLSLFGYLSISHEVLFYLFLFAEKLPQMSALELLMDMNTIKTENILN